ncbi:MAG: hypothetical protein JWR04_868 [Rhodoglobus sp.]|nr:hypothetical protein [Rhodoglobus sp.]
MAHRLPRRLAGAALAAIVALTLSACGTPPWEEASTSAPTASPRPTNTEITTVVNELATGSTKHELTAGSIGLAVDYYSTLSMDQWTADASKPLSISMVASITGDEGQAVYLSTMTLLVSVYGPDGKLTGPPELADRATVNPGYLVKTPYSYSQTFNLPTIDPDATYVQLSLTYELLLQSTPTSAQYAKQTASDTLTIAIAQP